MKRTFFRSLDRQMSLFGLRGQWIKIFLISLGAALGVALFAGMLAGMSVGLALFFGTAVISFFTCLIIQGKIPSRRISKVRHSGKMRIYVRRRELLSRILLSDPEFERFKNEN